MGSPARALFVEIALCKTRGIWVPLGTSIFDVAAVDVAVVEAAGAAAGIVEGTEGEADEEAGDS
jgi:hypothetical protein